MKKKVDFGIMWLWFYTDWHEDCKAGGCKTLGSCGFLTDKRGRRCASIWIDNSVNIITRTHVICHELIHVFTWILLGWCGDFHWWIQHKLDSVDYIRTEG